MAEVELPEEMVKSFREVCAVDEAKARQYLDHCDANLEDAVQLFFSTGGSLQNSYEGQHNIENDRREQLQAAERRPPARVQDENAPWWSTLVALISLPFRLAITTLYDIFGFMFQILGPPRPALTDPKGDVERFISGYNESLTGDTRNKIDFFNGSYEEVLKFARSNLRMVLVYVHHPNNNNSAKFINEVLHTEIIRNLIAEHELVVFGVATTSPQGRIVANALRSEGEPLVGLITFRNSTPLVALRLSGLYDPESVALNLRLACEDYQTQLTLLRMQKAQREENQRIREEQEREYRESAAKDRARIQERRRLESEKAEAEEVGRKKQQEREDRKALLETHKNAIRAAASEEPSGADLVRIQIRFPSGARLDRKYSPDDSLEILFEAAVVHEQCPLYFTAFTNFPRKEIPCAPTWYHEIRAAELRADGLDVPDYVPVRTFRDEGLDCSCVVMIQDCLA